MNGFSEALILSKFIKSSVKFFLHLLAACVMLDEGCEETLIKNLWGNDFSEEELNDLISSDSYFDQANNKRKKELIKKLAFAEKAHITIGLADQEKAAQSGYDIMNLKLRLKLNEILAKSLTKYEHTEFEFFYVNNCYSYAKLKEPLLLSGIFTAYF